MTAAGMIEHRIVQRIRDYLAGQAAAPFSIQLPNGHSYTFGEGNPAFSVVIKDPGAIPVLLRFDELGFAETYLNGGVDIEGSMWDVMTYRKLLEDAHPAHHFWQRVLPWLAGQVRENRRAIREHYEHDSDIYLKLMGSTRCYSQAIYERDDEPLDVAQRRKLDFVIQSCGMKPGDRVLDVGGGWGTFVEHAGKKGIHVTALTIARQSEAFINGVIQRENLPCQVVYGDFYQHSAAQPYDAIAILGVMEHLPDYASVVKQFMRLVKPGGRIYLDASSFREKYSKPTFISRYVFPGNHRFFCLHDFLDQVSRTNLEVVSIHNDRHSYYLTCLEWSKRLDAARDEIVSQYGEKVYRIFRLYLWGAAHSLYTRGLDAFRVVLERPE
jgi:cyclopropane-fatty-acyl-phospholipid synthase